MKSIITIFILLFTINTLNAQNSEIDNNIIKYWNYRDRLVNDFIAIGDKPGQSLPFSTRNEREMIVLDHGQGPMVLGQYIGVLASEYKLLNQNNQDTEQTLKELYYALYAFNRLDLVAETVNGYNKPPKLDGFFIREDFPNDFVTQNPSFNKNTNNITNFIFGSGKSFNVKCTTFKGTYRCGVHVDKNCNVKGKPVGFSSKYNHKPLSLDQFLGVLVGISLVNKLVDNDAKYLDNKFQDNEISIKQEAKNIAKRMISYAKKYHWTPKEPDGDYMGDCDFTTKTKPNYFKNNSTMLYFSRFISNIGKNIYGKKYSYLPLIDSFDGMASMFSNFKDGSFYNLRMYIEVMALSNKNNALFTSTRKRVKQISKIYNWETFYYTLGFVLHDWNKKDIEIINKSLIMLSNAPYDGPFFHGINDFAKGGWASENRFSASVGEQYKGSRFPKITGNYSGLDYMLLHNLHLLAYASLEEISSFGKLKNNSKKYNQNLITIDKETCIKAEKQSCKERHERYKFMYKYPLKKCFNCNKECTKKCGTDKKCLEECSSKCKSKKQCKANRIKYINKYYNIDFNPKQSKCKKETFVKKCSK